MRYSGSRCGIVAGMVGLALVASSGDLGVTVGYIRTKDGSRPPVPFFTVWRRDSPASPWRYIAE